LLLTSLCMVVQLVQSHGTHQTKPTKWCLF